MKSIYKITFLFLLIPYISFGNNGDKKHEKNKIIEKKFSVNADAKVSLNNRYGNLHITTWNKNEVDIKVEIIVKGDDLEVVEDKLASIDVDFDASASFVNAKTIFGNKKNSWSWWKKSKNMNYQINYTVRMPKSNSVDLDNDYGAIYLDKLSGQADINCDYGKISVGELSAPNNSINLDYCSKSTIAYMKSGNVNVDYSKLTIEDSKKIRFNTDYSTIVCNKAETINFNADYGSITFDDVVNVSGNSDYTSMRFGNVRKNLKIDTDYGSIKIANLSKGFESVDISSEYAGIRIGIEQGNVFDFVLNLQYAGFKRNDSNIELFKSISKSSKKYYEGKYGKGNTNSKIKISSQYGGVSFK
ncbi:MAG: hypothetical protein ACPG44_06610 [Polaribacter sp.]